MIPVGAIAASRLRGAGGGPSGPISFVGSKTATDTAGTANINVSLTDLLNESNVNASLQEFDLVLVAVATNLSGDGSFTPPPGWTEETELFADDSSDINFYVLSKFMGGSPDTSVSVQGSGDTAAGTAIVVHAFRGVDTSSYLDVPSVTATGVNTGRPNPPAITPVTAGSWIYVAGGGTTGAGVLTPFSSSDLSATTNHFRSTSVDDSADSIVGAGIKTDWAAGAFDPATWTGGDGASTRSWAAITMALRSAP